MGECVPVLVSVYHRLYTLGRCIEALRNNAEARFTDLFVVSDAAAKPQDEARVTAVRKFVEGITGFKSVTLIARPENWGANRSVMGAIGELLNRFGRLIFMEDDILPSKYFLEYMNKGLEVYINNPKVFAICGYKGNFRLPRTYKNDLFVLQRYSPWGIGLWADKYFAANLGPDDRYMKLKEQLPRVFDFYTKYDPMFLYILKGDSEGSLKAADVRMENHLLYSGQVCIYPRQTMTNVMESWNDSMHAGITWRLDEKLMNTCPCDFGRITIDVNPEIYQRFLKSKYPSRLSRFFFALRHHGIRFVIRYYFNRIFKGHAPIRERVGSE